MSKVYDVLCFGAVNCDMVFSGLQTMPVLGSEEFCSQFKVIPGGGANTAMGLAKLGLQVCLYTRLGQDVLGNLMRGELIRTGIMPEGLKQENGVRTSVSAVLSCGGERGFATFDQTGMETMDQKELSQALQKARHLHTYLGYAKAMDLCTLAKQAGCTVSLDAGYDPNARLDDYREQLEMCDVFFPNEQEALSLTGEAAASEAAVQLGRYAKTVVVKLGNKGCLCHQDKETLLCPGSPVEAVDTCGAGDAFAAGFLKAWLGGASLADCGAWGNASGGVSVGYPGGMDDMYTLEAVENMLLVNRKG